MAPSQPTLSGPIMPELPEVETVRLGLAPVVEGARISRVALAREGLRFPFPKDLAARLEGRTIVALGRRAKFLLAELDEGSVLILHLGMSGSLRVVGKGEGPGAFHYPRGRPRAHDHVVITLSNGATIIFNDPRRFGLIDLVARADLAKCKHLRGLGTEPLDPAFDAGALARLLAGRRAPLKAALMDQRLIAGLGNIYVCEALHRARLSPRRAAGTLARRDGTPTARADHLAKSIVAVLGEAIVAGGATLRDHRQANGELGYFQHRLRVYDREGEACPNEGCAGVIRRATQSGRSTFFCPRCQR
jgi:formamidopyrimidine-DNA glycosylase